MIPVINWEGYVDGTYEDTKGIKTTEVGQTGAFADMSFPDAFEAKKQELKKLTPDYDNLPDRAKDALLVANYRGDWLQAPKTRKLFNTGNYKEAAAEFLNNAEYKNDDTPIHIKKRFEYIANVIRNLD